MAEKQTVQYQDDDYGVEVFKKKDTKPKKEADTKP